MRVRNTDQDGIPLASWEKASLLGYFFGLLIRTGAFLIVCFAAFAAAKAFAWDGNLERISWAELTSRYWTQAPLMAIVWIAYCMADEAWRRRERGRNKPAP